MQDNRNNDQQFIDKGWQLMSALLDNEMPQGRRNRKFAWWLVAAGLALILSGWGYHLLQNKGDQIVPEKPVSINEQPGIAIAKEEVHSELFGTEQQKLSDNQNMATSQASMDISHLQNPSVKTLEEISASEGAAASKRPNVQVMNEQVASGSVMAAAVTESRVIDPMDEIVRDGIVPSISHKGEIVGMQELNEVEIDGYSKVRVSPREEISVALLYMPNPEKLGNASRTLPIKMAHATKVRGFGLEGFFATHLNSDGNPFYGVEAGLSAVWRTNKRFRVHTGLSYGYYNVDGLGVFGLSKNMDDAEALNSGSGTPPFTGVEFDVQDVYSNSLPFSEAKILTEKFHYLHMPLYAEYLITPRLSAMTGVKVSALIGAPARYRLNDARFSASQPLASSGSKSFLYNYDILRKFDIAPMIGVSYSLGGRWSLSASYTHGLVHYINSSETAGRNDLHRSASVGVRYRIL